LEERLEGVGNAEHPACKDRVLEALQLLGWTISPKKEEEQI
jgi:hypothetical protein